MLPLDEPLTGELPALDWAELAHRARELAAEALRGSVEDAADVAQDAVLKLLLIEHPPRSIDAWLRIVVARGVARIRSRDELARETAAGPAVERVRAPGSPETRVFVREILAHFPPDVRRLLVLHAEGVSNRDLARVVRGRRVVVARRLRSALEEARRIGAAQPLEAAGAAAGRWRRGAGRC